MLKITIHPGGGELRLQLEGRLAGPWVAELRQCWQAAAADGATVLDLREVDFVDCDGQALLAEMHRRGVRLEASGPFIEHILEEIASPDCATVEEAPPGRLDDFVSAHPRNHFRAHTRSQRRVPRSL